jgi:predicted ribosomally synthesized peptide with nif11-like leader
MSVESAKKFVERLANDAEFRAQVESAPDPATKKKLVQAAGYDFDMADISAVLPQSAGGELSDAELEGVAGGSADTSMAVTAYTISATASAVVTLSIAIGAAAAAV